MAMCKRIFLLLMMFALVYGLMLPAASAGSWYWKPAWPDSPSGMPDFDMNQDFDGNADGTINPIHGERADGVDLFYCTPTATANSIWWYGSIPGNTEYMGNPTNLRYPALADVDQDGTIDRSAGGGDSPMNLVQSLAYLMDTNDQRTWQDTGVFNDNHSGTWIPWDLWLDQYTAATRGRRSTSRCAVCR